MIDFTLTEEQRQIQRQARTFAQDVLANASQVYSKLPTQRERFESLRPLYRKAVEAGLIKAAIPVPLGGLSTGLVDAAIAMEEQYAVDPSLALTVATNVLGLLPLFFIGSPEQHEKFLKPFLSGNGEPTAALVHSEPEGTSNWLQKGASGLQTTAKREGDFWVINGTKLWTTNSGGWDGKGADVQCVVCRAVNGSSEQDPTSDPRESIILLMVTRELVSQNVLGAYEVLDTPELIGHRATSSPKSHFKDFKVPIGVHVLAEPGGSGVAAIEQTFGFTAGLVGVFATSIMRYTFEAAMKFAKADTRGGTVPIVEHQSVADILMDIKMRTDACRMMTWKALHAMEHGPGDSNARLELCLEVKIFCSELAVKSVTDAMRAVGVNSYGTDQPFAQWLNDAMVLPLFDGGNVGVRRRQIQRLYENKDYEPWAAI